MKLKIFKYTTMQAPLSRRILDILLDKKSSKELFQKIKNKHDNNKFIVTDGKIYKLSRIINNYKL